jgi:hypothetical protein
VVLSGLHAGDRIVVDGVLKVIPGRPVKIVDKAETAPAKTAEGSAKGAAKGN